jgi:hypothetical protein
MAINCVTQVSPIIQRLFNRAIEIITPHVKPEKITVILCRKNFPIFLDRNHVGVYFRNLIAFDLDKLENTHKDIVVAVFLEEFVHCLMPIDSETEVGYRVSEIYPKVGFDGKKYFPK